MSAENFQPAASKVTFVGDSLIEQGDWATWFPQFETHNLGVDGDTTDRVLERLDSIVSLEPDAVVLQVGTNDLANRRSVEHLVRNIEFLLVNLRRHLPGARTLTQSILPRGKEFAQPIQDANRHLRQFSPSVRAQYLDLWPALALDNCQLNPEYSEDLLHLNEAGYDAWLRELRPALERLQDAPPMSRPIQIVRPNQMRAG